MAGSTPSPRKSSAERFRHAALAAALAAGTASFVDCGRAQEGAQAQGKLRRYAVVADAIPESLTGAKGDPERGRAIVVNRQVGLCLLCHSVRIVDARRLNADTIMPAYYRVDGLTRVAPAFQGKPVLTAEQIEDVVAHLATLRD